ncbi:zinc transport system ATP-binding protein [Natronoarchaeum philippinense]|uniref:Cobalamin import ATP-binding protein BtuD n=1 Tax=Natronoarchaeum philippinense TaxID=558529 RepID=A0A285N086_NATPI|nr:metal ABC transporter ATP-binding protein [Natronoarchaeum philippinense]SNZ02748.1 zinc transport system ATP-binding protein [Natronoarchaeum philippinense]
MSVVELEDVTFSYTEVPVLEGVDLSIEEGEFLGLVGPNGSGKSTLLRIALGLESPDSGTAELFGEPAEAFDDGHRIGYVAQGTTSLDQSIPVTVSEAVTMGRFPHAGYGRLDADDRDAVEDAMETVGVSDLASRKLDELSGGQRQRVFIARALACEADLLALDEPTVGVDAESRDAFYDLLAELNDRGIAIVLIEHDIGTVTEYATTVACINQRVHYHGDPEGFAESDALADAYGAGQRVLEHDHSAHDHGGDQ